MRPVVSVPVLSMSTVRICRACSKVTASLMRIPSCPARPDPTMMAVGVANPKAQGHAMISTETVFTNAVSSPDDRICAVKVTAAMSSTTGTKTAATRSTRR